VFGFRLVLGRGSERDTAPSLHRFYHDEGYVPGNVAVISWRANRLLSDASPSELRRLLEWLTDGIAHERAKYD